jgi:hypothetical protein
MKHSRLDIANVVRELSKVLDGPTDAAMKELKRAIKFVLTTSNYGLKIEPELNKGESGWEMKLFTDSEYAGNKDTRISVGGYIIFLLGVGILWKSKAQKLVTLSSRRSRIRFTLRSSKRNQVCCDDSGKHRRQGQITYHRDI